MTRSLTITLAILGSLAGSAFAQSTTGDPIGINVIDEPTITQQRAEVGQNTYSTIPRGQRTYWDNGTWLDLNLDGQIDGE
jgi:hypothetical protein